MSLLWPRKVIWTKIQQNTRDDAPLNIRQEKRLIKRLFLNSTAQRSQWNCHSVNEAPSTAGGEIWKRRFHSENASICFPSMHTAPEKSENAVITIDWKAWVQPLRLGLITRLSRHHRFQKPPFSKRFPSTLKRMTSVFTFLRFDEGLRKVPFSVRLVWTVHL